MKNKSLAIIIVITIIVFAAVSAFIFMRSYGLISSALEDTMGDGVTDMATVVADEIVLTDADVEELKNISFKELPANEVNKKLDEAVGELNYSQDFRFAYLMSVLEGDEIKHFVTKKTEDFYGRPVGTPLNVIWLLDVPVDNEERASTQTEQGFNDYYKENERYSYLRPYEKKIFKEKKPAYALSDDEYGSFITGYAPVYTVEGSFVGMVGLDIHQAKYIDQKTAAFKSIVVSFCITLLVLGIIIFLLYYKYNMAEARAKYIDALTGAHNRRYINELLHERLNGKRFSGENYLLFMMIDFDKFKNINDTYGHAKGDACLRMMTPAFEKVAGKYPGRISRFGGEEFVAVVGIKSKEEAPIIAADLLQEVRDSDPMESGVHITVSIGAYVIPYSESTPASIEENIRLADDNLYKAKDNGRDRVELSFSE